MRISLAGALVALSLGTAAHVAIKEEPVTYKDGETTMKGFVVYDDAITAYQSIQSKNARLTSVSLMLG